MRWDSRRGCSLLLRRVRGGYGDSMKVLLLAFCATCALAGAGERKRPLMRDFIGINVDAAQSKPGLYASAARVFRSYPEDPATHWMENLQHLQKWRAEHAPTKELWEVEFGYDASPKRAQPSGEFARWQGVTEEQQAMWTVRSFLLLAGLGVDRAHLFSANDAGDPQVRVITRNFQPKPVFHALAWLQRSLGEYRFARVEREDAGDCYCYEFIHGTDAKKRVWAIWKPTGEPLVVRLFHDPLHIVRAERMPLNQGDVNFAKVKLEIEGYFAIQADERPVFVWLDEK